MSSRTGKYACWIALACLVVPMFASYFFDDMFSTISYLFEDPARTQLGWDAVGYGLYTSGYSVLCVFGGLVVCGILLDKWGVRVTGSIFVGMMAAGAAAVLYAITAGLPPERSLRIAYAGCMFFGLGSEIAGTAVTRSIAKWFRHGPMALAMGLQLAVARLGTALALVLSPRLVVENAGHVYSLAETARPAVFGLGLMAAGLILWAIFVAMDARFDKGILRQAQDDRAQDDRGQAQDDKDAFRMADVLGILKNGNFWLVSLLCVLFYSSIIAFKKFAGAILIPRFAIPAETARASPFRRRRLAGWCRCFLSRPSCSRPCSACWWTAAAGGRAGWCWGRCSRLPRTCCSRLPRRACPSSVTWRWCCWASAIRWCPPPCGLPCRKSCPTRSSGPLSPSCTGCRTWGCSPSRCWPG